MEEGSDEEKKIQVEKTRGTQEFEGGGGGGDNCVIERREERKEI